MLFKLLKKNRNSKDIDYNLAMNILNENDGCILLDVRSTQEYKENNLKGSINIPLYELKKKAMEILKDKDGAIIVYCQSGGRSKKAVEILNKMGYKNLYNIKGGLDNI